MPRPTLPRRSGRRCLGGGGAPPQLHPCRVPASTLAVLDATWLSVAANGFHAGFAPGREALGQLRSQRGPTPSRREHRLHSHRSLTARPLCIRLPCGRALQRPLRRRRRRRRHRFAELVSAAAVDGGGPCSGRPPDLGGVRRATAPRPHRHDALPGGGQRYCSGQGLHRFLHGATDHLLPAGIPDLHRGDRLRNAPVRVV